MYGAADHLTFAIDKELSWQCQYAILHGRRTLKSTVLERDRPGNASRLNELRHVGLIAVEADSDDLEALTMILCIDLLEPCKVGLPRIAGGRPIVDKYNFAGEFFDINGSTAEIADLKFERFPDQTESLNRAPCATGRSTCGEGVEQLLIVVACLILFASELEPDCELRQCLRSI